MILTLTTPIEKYMTRSPYRVEETITIQQGLSVMQKSNLRHLPVVRNGRLTGVITSRDIASLYARGIANMEKTLIRDVMTSNPFSVSPTTPLAQVTEEMARHKYGCVIVCENEMVVGIFTAIDALRVLHNVCMEASKQSK